MPKQTLIDNESVSLWYHPEAKIIHHKIHRFMDPGVFQELLTKGADHLEAQGAAKWLSDDEKNVVVSPQDRKWGDEVWAPRVIAAGLKYWAVVTPVGAVASLQMKGLVEQYRQRGVTVETFGNVDDALAWLESR